MSLACADNKLLLVVDWIELCVLMTVN